MEPQKDPTAEDQRPVARSIRSVGPALTRFIIIAPVICLYIGAVTLSLMGAYETARTIQHIFAGEYGEKEALVAFIQLADLFLLGVVLYIIAIGLYELFIDDKLVLPEWLTFHDIDDLKHRLASVVIVVLAVMFLGSALESKEPMDILLRGAGTGLVILPLAYFLKNGSH